MAPGISRKTRRLFFYTLILVFFLLAPLLVALSYGYRLDLGTGEVEQRGGIFVKSRTPSLSIFLNGDFVKETSFISGGALLPEITPGSYLLRIEKEGFSPWSKTAQVKPSLVTELRYVMLIPRPLTATSTAKADLALLDNQNNPAKNFSLDQKNNLIQKTAGNKILAANVHSFGVVEDAIFFIDKNGFLGRLQLADGAVETLARPGFFLQENSKAKFSRSPSGYLAVLDDGEGLYVFNPAGTLVLLEKGIKNVSFDKQGDKMLMVKEAAVDVFWLRPNSYQPFQPAETRETVLTSQDRILDARWFYGDNYHLVIQTSAEVLFTELDGRGGRNIAGLVAERTDKIATSADQPNRIFYQKGKNWYTLEL